MSQLTPQASIPRPFELAGNAFLDLNVIPSYMEEEIEGGYTHGQRFY